MKKLFCLILAVLLLAGCTPAEPTQPATTQPTTETPVPTTTEYVPRELVQPTWSVGTISGEGVDVDSTSRLRTTEFLFLADYGGAIANPGYILAYCAYDENKTYLGASDFTESGVGFTTVEIKQAYPSAVWFRVLLDTVEMLTLVESHAAWSNVQFYGPKDPQPEHVKTVSFEPVTKQVSCQDGVVYDSKLFLFNAKGVCNVVDLNSETKAGKMFFFTNTSALIPHANSVCFSDQFYQEGDKYPLLYANIYNNYSDKEDRMEGTCCVYRLTETDGTFALNLVQVIKVGFAKDTTLWLSPEKNSAPYGNFVVDTDKDKLYAYVMRNESNSTRFFEFDLPAVTDGEFNEEYGCNMVTLQQEDYHSMFDIDFSYFIQGGCYRDGKIFSIEGMNSGSGKEPALRIIDLETQTLEATHYLAEAGLFEEPEMIDFDPDTGLLYYADVKGQVRTLTIPGINDKG